MTSAAAFFWSTCGAVMAVLCIALIVYWLPRRKVNRRVSRSTRVLGQPWNDPRDWQRLDREGLKQ